MLQTQLVLLDLPDAVTIVLVVALWAKKLVLDGQTVLNLLLLPSSSSSSWLAFLHPMMQAWAPVGMHKYHSFTEYVQLYPEYNTCSSSSSSSS